MSQPHAYRILAFLLVVSWLSACLPDASAANRQATVGAIEVAVVASATAKAGGATASPTTTPTLVHLAESPAGPQPTLPQSAAEPAAAATQMTAAAGGQPPLSDPALASQVALATAQAAGQPPAPDPNLAAQIAYATQQAQLGKPLDPAMLTQAAVTQAAAGPFDPAAATATAAAGEAAAAPIRAELPAYGVDPASGKLGWVHPPLTLETQGKRQYAYANDFIQVVAQDFVVSADITWNTRYGDSGCGFVLRSDGNKEAPNQYAVVITRGSSGHMIFSVMANGNVVTARDIYANWADPRFEWQNDTTNRLTVVGRGNLFTVYTNGTRLGVFDPTTPPPAPEIPPPPPKPKTKNPLQLAAYQKARAEYDTQVARIQAQYQARLKLFRSSNVVYERGLIAMIAATDNGYTQCKFNHAWLWLLE